jgi:hypothetical protein
LLSLFCSFVRQTRPAIDPFRFKEFPADMGAAPVSLKAKGRKILAVSMTVKHTKVTKMPMVRRFAEP